MIAVKRPASMSMLTSSSASTRASPSPYALVTPSARAAVPVVCRLSITVMVGTPGGRRRPVGRLAPVQADPWGAPRGRGARRSRRPAVARSCWPPPGGGVNHPLDQSQRAIPGCTAASTLRLMGPWRAGGHVRPEAVAGWLGAAGCVLAVYVVVVLGG